MLWQPIFIIALYIIALWRDFICTEIWEDMLRNPPSGFTAVRHR
jgi:hypothetical protein